MPRKVFAVNEILTASDVNEYLMNQTVMTFADSAARGSAIGTAVEGMVTYLEDTNQLEVYGGTATGWTSASNFLFGTAVPTDGQVLAFGTAVSEFAPVTLDLDYLDDVTIGTAVSEGQVLAYSTAVSGFVPADAATGGGAVDNLVYNGAMQVAQRGTSETGITSSGYYTADRWRLGNISLGTWTQTIEADGPTGSGFTKSLKLECTTADAAPAASANFLLDQRLEGQDLQGLKKGTSDAESLTFSFWVKSNVTGTYIAEIQDIDNTRQISASYSIDSSGTWEKKTITFPGDTAGILDNDNNASLRFRFWLGAGANFTSGTLNTSWASTTSANRAVGQTNLAAATSNYWQVTGVQLETGTVANAFEHKPYGVELAECQRYYQVIIQGNNLVFGTGFYQSSTSVYFTPPLKCSMRTAASLDMVTGTNYYAIRVNLSRDEFNEFLSFGGTENQAPLLYRDAVMSGTAGNAGSYDTRNAACFIALDAEL